MEEQQRNIDELFREALAGYREQAPEEAWQNVARHLDEGRRRRGGYGRWMILGLVMLISLPGAGWWAMRKPGLAPTDATVGTPQQAATWVPAKRSTSTITPDYVNNQEAKSAANNPLAPSKLIATITEKTAPEQALQTATPTPRTLARLHVRSLRLITGLSSPLTPVIRGRALDRSVPSSWLGTEAYTEAPPPALKGEHFKTLPAASPASSPVPLTLEIPGFEPQLPQDERLRSVGLKHIETRPSRVFDAGTLMASGLHLEEKRLPDAATVARTSSRGLPQAETDPLPLRSARYRSSFSVAAVATMGYSSVLRGHFEAGLQAMIQLSEHLALGLQPGISLSRLSDRNLTDATSYYQEQIAVDSFRSTDPSPSVRNSIDTIYNYVVRQTLDSIVAAGMAAGGNFWEFNLPLIARYSFNEHWYAYGGPSLNFAGKINVRSKGANQVFTRFRKDSLAQSEALPASTFEHYFGTSSLPAYSSYKPVDIQNTPTLRFGYLLGLGYSKGKYSGALNLSQQLNGFSDLPDAMQPAFSTPRVNLSFGYLLFDSRKSATKNLK